MESTDGTRLKGFILIMISFINDVTDIFYVLYSNDVTDIFFTFYIRLSDNPLPRRHLRKTLSFLKDTKSCFITSTLIPIFILFLYLDTVIRVLWAGARGGAYGYNSLIPWSFSLLKLSLHIRFPHVFTALRCIFYYLPWLSKTKVSYKKLQCSAVNACGNRMCKLSLNQQGMSPNFLSSK